MGELLRAEGRPGETQGNALRSGVGILGPQEGSQCYRG